eukprot:5786685-Prymnesium_polylepis.1
MHGAPLLDRDVRAWALARDICVLGSESCADGDRDIVNVWDYGWFPRFFELLGLLREATKRRQFLGPRLETGWLCLQFLGP